LARTESVLDADELVALALRATQRGDTQAALGHLERAVARDPRHGPAHHLRAGLYAGQKRFDLAIPEMQLAVELDADPAPARFELGMMLLSTGRIEEARRAWQPLEALGEEHALFLFQRGMLAMVADRFDETLADLERGIARNHANPSLNREMQKVIERVRRARAS
jgi:Tfp pilus assembly protein PilF